MCAQKLDRIEMSAPEPILERAPGGVNSIESQYNIVSLAFAEENMFAEE